MLLVYIVLVDYRLVLLYYGSSAIIIVTHKIIYTVYISTYNDHVNE